MGTLFIPKLYTFEEVSEWVSSLSETQCVKVLSYIGYFEDYPIYGIGIAVEHLRGSSFAILDSDFTTVDESTAIEILGDVFDTTTAATLLLDSISYFGGTEVE